MSNPVLARVNAEPEEPVKFAFLIFKPDIHFGGFILIGRALESYIQAADARLSKQ